jgi:hypothetical protein
MKFGIVYITKKAGIIFLTGTDKEWTKKLSIYDPNNCYKLSEIWVGSGSRIQLSKSTGSQIRIRNTAAP